MLCKIIKGSVRCSGKKHRIGAVIELNSEDTRRLQILGLIELVPIPKPEKPKEVEIIPEPPAIPEPEPVKEVVKKEEPKKVEAKPIRKDIQIITNKGAKK